VTLRNDDAHPTVSIHPDPTSVVEGARTTVTYTVTRSANATGAVTVVVGFTGTATRGVDYTVAGLSSAVPSRWPTASRRRRSA
jgi:hypothetical protein